MVWKPNVVAAAVIERDGRFLMVEEQTDEGRVVLNQPAGHLDPGETLFEAARREVLEETAWHFEPLGIVGLYLLPVARRDLTYLRLCFYGDALRFEPERPLDHGILRTHWFTYEELMERQPQHRSALVKKCMDDYLAGKRYPLDLLHHVSSESG